MGQAGFKVRTGLSFENDLTSKLRKALMETLEAIWREGTPVSPSIHVNNPNITVT